MTRQNDGLLWSKKFLNKTTTFHDSDTALQMVYFSFTHGVTT